MRLALLLGLPLLAVAPPSAVSDKSVATVNVSLANFRFAPRTIRLEQGRPYLLRLTNQAGGGHNFVARDFFAAASLDAASRVKVREGGVEMPARGAVDIRLTAPPRGRYKLRCTHFMHRRFGMTGEIIVH